MVFISSISIVIMTIVSINIITEQHKTRIDRRRQAKMTMSRTNPMTTPLMTPIAIANSKPATTTRVCRRCMTTGSASNLVVALMDCQR